VKRLGNVGRVQTRAAARIPDLDGLVLGRRRQPRRVVREGHRGDITARALERLQARAPAERCLLAPRAGIAFSLHSALD
jgi:hypothetical protein